MSSPIDLEAAGADYRAAKAELTKILQRMADAELERHRTGLDDGTVDALHADVNWCRALIVACGEVVKGASFADLIGEGA